MSAKNGRKVLLQIEGLKKYFPITRGVFQRHVGDVKAVDGISFEIYQGETLGLVGESGCGKSTTGRTILQLYRATEGTIHLDDIDLSSLKGRELQHMRRRMQMIFQDPYASLNPRMTVGSIIGEPLEI
jgi:oligopeptide transport system ATP-binding protein